jgi:hypothetical protein
MLATFSGTVGGQLRQVLLYLSFICTMAAARKQSVIFVRVKEQACFLNRCRRVIINCTQIMEKIIS